MREIPVAQKSGRGLSPSPFLLMTRIVPLLFLVSLSFFSLGSCQKPAPPETVFDIPIPPKSEFFREMRDGNIKIYKTKLSQKKILNFYKKHFTAKEASFFKKRDSELIMLAGNDMKVIEIITRDHVTYISYSTF